VGIGHAALEDMARMTGGWRGRRVLITGATGMVGSWLAKDLLGHGAEIVCLVHDADPQSELLRSGDILRTQVVNGRLEEFADVERAVNGREVDTVFHLGAQTIVGTARRDPLGTFEANIRGTYHVLEACRRHAPLVTRVVVASSDKAYGTQPKLPYVESMPLEGREPYEVSKSCTDLLAQSYYHAYRVPVAILRCGNIYGGGDLNWSRIIPGTIRSFLRGERPIIRSDGRFVRDYLYVKDVVRACLAVAERLDDPRVQGQGFNFSPQKPLTVLEVVEAIARAMRAEKLKPIIQNAATGEIRDQYLAAAKARRLLGWRAAYRLEQGLAETIDWYRAFLGGPAA
jgi:CDP-glucose 4,6-dehydratase